MNKSIFLFSGGELKHSARGGVRGRGVVRGGRGAPIMRGAINIRGAAMAARGIPVRGGRVMRDQPRPMAPGITTSICSLLEVVTDLHLLQISHNFS